jgi:hypothetical protein
MIAHHSALAETEDCEFRFRHANAVRNTPGKRFYSLPMSPPRVLEVLEAEG